MKINDIQRIEFFNREKEKQEILNILRTEPQIINFIYGLINSGKTTLITNLIENLPNKYVVFYMNLLENIIPTYRDFVEALFDKDFGEKEKLEEVKKAIPDIVIDLKTIFKIPIPTETLKRIFCEKIPKDAFTYVLNLIKV